jgi:hypothetical protein
MYPVSTALATPGSTYARPDASVPRRRLAVGVRSVFVHPAGLRSPARGEGTGRGPAQLAGVVALALATAVEHPARLQARTRYW